MYFCRKSPSALPCYKRLNLTLKQRLLLALFLSGIFFGVAWFLVLRAQILESSRLSHELNLLNLKYKANDLYGKPPVTGLADSNMSAVTTLFREEPSTGALLEALSESAKQAGLVVGSFVPMPEKKGANLIKIPISLKLEGTFHQLLMFFSKIIRFKSLVNFEEVIIESRPAGRSLTSPLIKVALIAASYRPHREQDAASREHKPPDLEESNGIN